MDAFPFKILKSFLLLINIWNYNCVLNYELLHLQNKSMTIK